MKKIWTKVIFLLTHASCLADAKIINQCLDNGFQNIEAYLRSSSKSSEVKLCLTPITDDARFFLYRRFATISYGQSPEIRDRITSKFSLMSYLACRESSGRVVAQVAHGIEGQTGAYHYGASYAELKKALLTLVNKRLSRGSKRHFDETTNGGLFQVSADQVDNVKHPSDPEQKVREYFLNRIEELSRLSQADLLSVCGTHEFFDTTQEPEVPEALSDSLNWIRNYLKTIAPHQKTSFRRVDELVWFHQLQTLCPDLNFELGKRIHHFLGGKYFGPLNNTRNSASCGTSYSLCRPVFENISDYINYP